MTADARLQQALDALRLRGERVTEARRTVLAALAGVPDHSTAEQVVAAVETGAGEVHRATVYRTLDTLTALGIVTHVHVGHGATAYHLGDRAHLHAQCRACGRVVDVPADVLDDAHARLREVARFHLDAAHVALSGLCDGCHTAGTSPGRDP